MADKRIPLHPDLIHPPTCPKCGSPIAKTHTWTLGAVSEASWLCGNQHQTLLKWAA